MSKYKGKYSGWDVNGRPFSMSEWKKSWVRGRGSYAGYLESYGRISKLESRRRKKR